MSQNRKLKPLALAMGGLLVGALSGTAMAADESSVFSATELSSGYQLAEAEGKCGEGKCGAEKKAEKAAEGKCGEGKCGEGKCGAEKKAEKAAEGKCGEGKCGAEKE